MDPGKNWGFPIESVIADPLYEPLKLNHYKLCNHLEMLSNFCQKPCFFSPYLLYDIEKMKKISEQIEEKIKEKTDGNEYFKEKIEIINFYHKETRKLIGLFLFCQERWVNRQNIDGKTNKNNRVFHTDNLEDLNNLFNVLELLRELILLLFKEMKDEYLKLLHGELLGYFTEEEDCAYLQGFPIYLKIVDNTEYSSERDFKNELRVKLENLSNESNKQQTHQNKNEAEITEKKVKIVEKIKKYLIDFQPLTNYESKNFELLFLYIHNNLNCVTCEEILSDLLICERANKKTSEKREIKFEKQTIPGFGKISFVNGYLYKYQKDDKDLKGDKGKKYFIFENYRHISSYFDLTTEIEVECPCPNCNKRLLMNEYGKILTLKKAILNSFELRRAKWLQMAASLHFIYRGATHTRLAHQIGTMMITVNSLNLIKVNIVENYSLQLAEYLFTSENVHEFLLANILHDIGHAPMSHVLESNPFLIYDHEDVTKDLISGGLDNTSYMNWYKTQYHYLALNKVHKHLEMQKRLNFCNNDNDKNLKFIKQIQNLIDFDIVLIKGIIDNFGLSSTNIVDILKEPKYPESIDQKLSLDNSTIHEISVSEKYMVDLFSPTPPKDKIILNKLLESEIDFDRIDHVKRDSMMSGTSLVSFKLDDLLGSLSIIMPESSIHKKIQGRNEFTPYIMISENGFKYFLDLLNTRKLIFRDILYSDQNNWLNGILNQVTAFAIQYQPHMAVILPFITDQVVYHLYNHESMNLPDIQKYMGFLQGKLSYSVFGEPWRYRLNIDCNKKISRQSLQKIYEEIEKINANSIYLYIPKVIFYTNITPKKEPSRQTDNGFSGNVPTLPPNSWSPQFVYGARYEHGYYRLCDLSTIKENNFGESFSRPREDDVKNLLYIWVNKLSIFENAVDPTSPIPKKTSEEKVVEHIQEEICKILNKQGKTKTNKKFDEFFDSIYIIPKKEGEASP